MKEYLFWFDNLMLQKGKKVLLLIDNFSAHKLAVKQMEEARAFKAIKVYKLIGL